MIRTMSSIVIGFILLVIESFAVMDLKRTDTIVFGDIKPFITLWTLNFFFVFTLMTHVYFWYISKNNERDLSLD